MKVKIAVVGVTSSLDYGYSNIQNTYSGSASDVMFFPTGSTKWVSTWFNEIIKK
jgi:hypothetical protein